MTADQETLDNFNTGGEKKKRIPPLGKKLNIIHILRKGQIR